MTRSRVIDIKYNKKYGTWDIMDGKRRLIDYSITKKGAIKTAVYHVRNEMNLMKEQVTVRVWNKKDKTISGVSVPELIRRYGAGTRATRWD